MEPIRTAVVLGAGTMGAQIAAHLANAGVRTTLLDIPPSELTETEAAQGKKLSDPEVRNRIVREGHQRAMEARPAAFFTPDVARRIRLGNLEDDLATVADADWVIEAIVENLDIKRRLMERLDALRGERTVISTNTSGIPVASIAEGRSEGFRRHFLGTHFFNPPRYLRLLEVIPTDDTDPDVRARIENFAATWLGKGVVHCKDTPNFIANRLGSVGGAFLMDYVLEHGYSVEEVDALTGPLLGRPKTGTFRLLDLVGLDVAGHVRRNLAEALPDDEASAYLNSPAAEQVFARMMENGWLGNKAGQGFYKPVVENGSKSYWPLNLDTLEYEAPQNPRFESVGTAKDLPSAPERIRAMLAAEDRAGELVRQLTFHSLAYASHRIPEIADTPHPIDEAVRLGFMHKLGPFETWDTLGVADTAKAMEAAGHLPAPWVGEMLGQGTETFYQYEAEQPVAVYDPAQGAYTPLKQDPKIIHLAGLKEAGKCIDSNDGASLIDLGDGVLCLEFHTKANALDEDILRLLDASLDRVEREWTGLVIGNHGENFCLGANLFTIAVAAQNELWDQLEEAASALQTLTMRMRYFSKPIVAAPAGMALGGGCELLMAAPRVVSAAEAYIGLVEVGAGVIPAGGGSKEMLRRVVNPAMRTEFAQPLAFVQRVMETIGQAKVGTSAEESRGFGYLSAADRVVLNREHLLEEAKREVLHLAPGYRPPVPEQIYAAGRDVRAALEVGVFSLLEADYISEHDAKIGKALVKVLTGGAGSEPGWVDEWYILDLEREAFLSLCGEEKTQQRMWHLLQKGKPLRN